MTKRLSIDFETGSACDLIARGAYNYAIDPTTEVYMMGWAFDDEDVDVWTPDQIFPKRVAEWIKNGGMIDAWNAQFERLIFWYVLCNDYDVPIPEAWQFRCTAARARTSGLPGKLSRCARAMGIKEQKQEEGRRLINTYSAMNVPWDEIPDDDWALFIEYCAQDVVVERQLGTCLRHLTPREQIEYQLNEEICDRGIPVDIPVAKAAMDYADDILEDVNGNILRVTDDRVKTARARKTRDVWLRERLDDTQLAILTDTDNKIHFDKDLRAKLLAAKGLNGDVREFTELVEEAGGATLSKYVAMLQRSVDGRVQGALMFNGAGATGRFSSISGQWHNLLRDTLEAPETTIELLLGWYELDKPARTLARLVRSTIMRPEGLSWFDYSAIEGRVAPWLANSPKGEAKLQLYKDGVDPYIYNAAETFNVPLEAVTKEQRAAGKVQELALQFLGGVGALEAMAAPKGLSFTEAEMEHMRDSWRRANPWAKEYGGQLEAAAMNAMIRPGEWQTAGRISYAYDGGDWLWCKLPSGRMTSYYRPKLTDEVNKWNNMQLTLSCLWGSGKPKRGEAWPRRNLHPGILIENVTQAAAADLLRDALIRVDKAGLKTVLHVHDEIVIEGKNVKKLGKLMLASEPWAETLPLAGDGGTGKRYGK